MEVDGSKPEGDDPVPQVPSTKKDRFCKPCIDGPDGEQIPATGYCRQCNEFICEPCVKFHRKFKASKSHEIIKGEEMPEAPLADDPSDVVSYENCELHSSPALPVLVKFHCGSHDQMCCGECIAVDHKSCTTEYIQDVAKKEHATLQKALKTVDKKVENYQATINRVYESNVDFDLKAMKDIRKFKTEVITYIEKKTDELLGGISSRKDIDEQEKKAGMADYLQAKQNISYVRKQVKAETGNVNKYFVELKQNKSRVQKIEKRIQDLESNHAAKRRSYYTFQPEPALFRMLKSQKPFGALRNDISKATLTMVENVNIAPCARSRYSLNNFISGMVLVPPRSLLVADYYGNAVMAVDLTTHNIQSYLKLASGPWDLAILPNDEIAVTLEEMKKIQILKFQNGELSKVRSFSVSEKCSGIVYNNNMLVVTYVSAAKVECMDLNGRVIECFQTFNGHKLFKNPYYATITNDQTICVSDQAMDTITMLKGGTKSVVHKLSEYVRGPTGMFCCPDGTLLVCGNSSNNIQVLSGNGTTLGVISLPTSYMCMHAVVVPDDMDMMYISIGGLHVKAYKLTYK